MIVDKATYRDGLRQDCGDLSDELAALRATPGSRDFLWIGLKDPSPAELALIQGELDLHPLAVEDIADPGRARPKIDYYDDTAVAIITSLEYIEATSDIESGVIKVVVSNEFVLTVRTGEVHPLSQLRQRLETRPDVLRLGPYAVLHAVLDSVVDTFLAVEREVAIDLEAIEQGVFGDRHVNSEEIYRLKREVLEFKHAAVPLVRPLTDLHGKGSRAELKELRVMFKDVADHVLMAVDRANADDNLLSDILSAHLAQIQVQQNEDMRKISAWAAMAAVPTMIAGIYGMNFENMPELRASAEVFGHRFQYGYFLVLAVIAVLCLTLYREFRKRHWL